MAQSTILAVGKTAATSDDVTILAGATATVGIFSAQDSAVPLDAHFYVLQDTPGADSPIGVLNGNQRSAVLTGPGTFRIKRTAYERGDAFGVFVEE